MIQFLAQHAPDVDVVSVEFVKWITGSLGGVVVVLALTCFKQAKACSALKVANMELRKDKESLKSMVSKERRRR